MPSLGNDARLEDLRLAGIEAESLAELYLILRKPMLAAEALKVAYEVHDALQPTTDNRHLALLEKRASLELSSGMVREALSLFETSLQRRSETAIGSATEKAVLHFTSAVLRAELGEVKGSYQSMAAAFLELNRIQKNDEKRQATVKLQAISNGLIQRGKFESAEQVIEMELMLVRQLGAVADGVLPDLHGRLSVTRLMQGQHAGAVSSAEEELKLLKDRYIGEHPHIIDARRKLARLYMLAKNPIRAEALATQNTTALEQARDKYPATVIARGYLDAASYRLGNCKFSEAAELLKQAELLAPSDDQELKVDLMEFRSGLLRMEQKPEEARALIDEAVALGREVYQSPEDQQYLGALLLKQADALIAATEFDAAQQTITEAEALLRQSSVTASPYRASVFNVRGDLAEALGQGAEVGRWYAAAVDEIAKLPAYRGTVVEVPYLIDLAGWEIENQLIDEAIVRLGVARRILEEGGRSSHVAMIGVLSHLIQAYERLGDSETVERLRYDLAGVYTDLQFMNDGKLFRGDNRPDLWD
jgi:tetratricopeptide (TPR) repeat protein